jgi:hypothetical protein
VIERPQRRSWRAGYVIVPIAAMVALFQIFILSDHDRVGRSEDGGQQAPASDAPSSITGPAAEAPQAERQSAPGSLNQSAEGKGPPLPVRRPLAGSAGAADEATTSSGPTPIRVFIHHAAGAGNALSALQLAAFLQTRGFAVTDIRPSDVEIERPSVRYFFERDRRETRRLVETIGAFFAKAPGQGPDQAADFSRSSPKPPEGSVEVWLPPPGAREQHSA